MGALTIVQVLPSQHWLAAQSLSPANASMWGCAAKELMTGHHVDLAWARSYCRAEPAPGKKQVTVHGTAFAAALVSKQGYSPCLKQAQVAGWARCCVAPMQGLWPDHVAPMQGLCPGHVAPMQGLCPGDVAPMQGLCPGHVAPTQGLCPGHAATALAVVLTMLSEPN